MPCCNSRDHQRVSLLCRKLLSVTGASLHVSVGPLATSEKGLIPSCMWVPNPYPITSLVWGRASLEPACSFHCCVSVFKVVSQQKWPFFWATQAIQPENNFLFMFLTTWAVCPLETQNYCIRKRTADGGRVWTHNSWDRACNYRKRAVPLRFAFQVCSFSFHGFWAFLMLKEKPPGGKQWKKKEEWKP